MINGPSHQIMQEPHSLTVIIVAKNEERNITECVASASFADEWPVLDSSRSDSAVAPATAAGAPRVQTDGPRCGPQEAPGISMARCAWGLSLDANERITATLRQETEVTIRSDARGMCASGNTGGVWKGLVHGVFAFFRSYRQRLGFVVVQHGLMQAAHNAQYKVYLYLNLMHLENPPRRPEFPA